MASNLQKTIRSINIENPQTAPKAASTVLAAGIWLGYNGSGQVVPLGVGAGNPIVGLNLSPIAATDPDYASTKLITYDGIAQSTDRFEMPVTNGTAIASMIGSPFNVYTDSYGLDVSGAGVQFRVTKVISTTLVEVEAILVA